MKDCTFFILFLIFATLFFYGVLWIVAKSSNELTASAIVHWEDKDAICYVSGANGYISCVKK